MDPLVWQVPFPASPQLQCYLFPVYSVLRISGMKLKSPLEGALLLPAVPVL